MLTDVLEWLYPYRNFFSFLIVFCSVVNNYLWAKHVNEGKCRADDFGYFLRLWRKKNSRRRNRDGVEHPGGCIRCHFACDFDRQLNITEPCTYELKRLLWVGSGLSRATLNFRSGNLLCFLNRPDSARSARQQFPHLQKPAKEHKQNA